MQGVKRTYQLYVPRSYDGTQAVPVVFEFHGYASNATQQVSYGNFRPLADRDGFLIVAPDGQGTPRHYEYTRTAGGAERHRDGDRRYSTTSRRRCASTRSACTRPACRTVVG